MIRFVKIPLLMFAIALLAGCQTGGGIKEARKSSDGLDSIEARATARWGYLIAKQADKAYEYLTPGFRKSVSKEQYAASKNNVAVKWQKATVNKKECKEEVCDVYLSLDYEVRLPNAGGGPISAFAPVKEKWVLVGKKWYFLPDK